MDAAVAVGRKAAEERVTIVYGGGRVGLMGAVAGAALAAGGDVIGVIPKYLCDREVLHPDLTETHIVDDLFARKEIMLQMGDAFATLPGGLLSGHNALRPDAWRPQQQPVTRGT